MAHSHGERGVTLVEVAIVALAGGLIIAALVGARGIVRGTREDALARQAASVVAAFNLFIEEKGELPGDLNRDGIMEATGLDGDPVADLRDAGFIGGDSVHADPALLDYIELPFGLLGYVETDATTSTVWDADLAADNVHVLSIVIGDAGFRLRVDALLDDGNLTTGWVRDDTANTLMIALRGLSD